MFGLDNIGSVFNLGNMYYHQLVADLHPNLVSKFAYLKDLDDVYPFNINKVDKGKEDNHGK